MTNGFNNRHSQRTILPRPDSVPFTGCAHPPSDHNSSEQQWQRPVLTHTSPSASASASASASPQPQPHLSLTLKPGLQSLFHHTHLSPSADKQKVLSPSLPDPSPSSSCSSAERTTIHQPIVTHPAPATSSLELPSVDTWNQSANSSSPSNYLHRNNIPPPIFIPSPASSSTTNLKSNLDQFKYQHRYHHPNENLLLGDNTNTTQNKTIIQHSNFHAHPRASVPPHSPHNTLR
ncbi:hypothetical protein PCASD_17799 [Puccinia coronata f. sp. avenae]|uniref:Uncharacterized protein n=1 Tax=Puccinia coronata f. sp. avenae TaxID=200324 RepID=A0A2N5TBQ2_9BASI|nr:hypothetical protein PCASD_17799 [Puccinia coronata f. sp. avenae]